MSPGFSFPTLLGYFPLKAYPLRCADDFGQSCALVQAIGCRSGVGYEFNALGFHKRPDVGQSYPGNTGGL